MFNDPLTSEQCSNLVERLAACAFPFQCAHGRPSMVPLVHLTHEGGHDPQGMVPGERAGDLAAALQSWKRRLRETGGFG